MQHTPIVQPRKISDDEWGVFTEDPNLQSGDMVTVVTDNGRRHRVQLEMCVKEDLYGYYWSTVREDL